MPDYPVPDMADVDLVDILRALADPTRLQIVRKIADGQPCPKSIDVWGVELTKATMSHHFKILREAGLTRTLVTGRTHAIQLRRDELDACFPGLIDAVLDAAH
ncbi:MAG TPA: ArsR family transcriptional regulator [Cellulomonas sp.]